MERCSDLDIDFALFFMNQRDVFLVAFFRGSVAYELLHFFAAALGRATSFLDDSDNRPAFAF